MIQFRSICLSAHLDSFCQRLNELANCQFEFIYKETDPGASRRKVGWKLEASYRSEQDSCDARNRALLCDVLIDMLREFDLFKSRVNVGKKTVYMCERWLKPLVVCGCRLPGIFRIFVPSYFKMTRQLAFLMDKKDFLLLPIGVHAAKDFVRLYRLMHGDIRCLFTTPKVNVDRQLGGDVEGFPNMKLWGYFVEPSMSVDAVPRKRTALKKLLWVGRMLDWKCIDTLIRAVKKVDGCSLIICGEGPERKRLEKLAGDAIGCGLEWIPGKVCFNDYIPNVAVRELMRKADAYVMPSNAEEGWGAAVSDALAEGCPVISTFEAGSSATLLPDACLYHAGDVEALVRILLLNPENISTASDGWSGCKAADILMHLLVERDCNTLRNRNG